MNDTYISNLDHHIMRLEDKLDELTEKLEPIPVGDPRRARLKRRIIQVKEMLELNTWVRKTLKPETAH